MSSKEEPYDIFICYKETDEKGDRTIDSVIAQDVYNELTDKGYRVFFSRITLEDKLGQEYEPYIFAALNSAKIMLAFGTDYEYYNAVWVKNEWSRFLQLIARGEKKTLIPCYKNIDAYDMPKEFARLQAQDMGKVGAVQDLLRGIEKIIGKNAPVQQVTEKVVVTSQSGGPNVEALLKRGNMALEDGNFNQANDFFNQVLNMNAECAEAYLGLAMAEQKVSSLNVNVFNLENKNFLRAKQYADSELLDKIAVFEKNVAIEIERLNEQSKIEAEKRRILEEELKIKRREMHIKARKVASMIAIGFKHVMSLKSDGTISAKMIEDNKKENYGQCDVYSWTNIVAIAAGFSHSVGLKSDGTVVAVGKNEDGQCNVTGWTDIVAIATGWSHTVGLKSNGTLVATGKYISGFDSLTDVVEIVAERNITLCVMKNGTVSAFGENAAEFNGISEWKDILGVTVNVGSLGDVQVVGLKFDGNVVVFNSRNKDISQKCGIDDWHDIVDININDYYTAGLKSDGKVVFKGTAHYRQSSIEDYKNIVAIYANSHFIAGIKSDGSISVEGHDDYWCLGHEKLFDDFNNLEQERKIKMPETTKRIMEKQRAQRRSQNLCQYCGGTFKGMFTKKCTNCGREKDY